MSSTLTIPTPRDFDFTQAITTYGYSALAPNQWQPDTRTLHRPLNIHGHVYPLRITHAGATRPERSRREPSSAQLRIHCHTTIPRTHYGIVKRQVARIFHLDTPASLYRRFWKLHRQAKRDRFGRIFRSPTLFEDIIKTITGCNVAWANTKSMNRHLCEKVGTAGAFPTPHQLARCTSAKLKRDCRVGYRAERIIRFARDVDSGTLDLDGFENPARTTDDLYAQLRTIFGIGDYAANNILQHIDRYDRLPVDSETIRHFRQVHEHQGDAKQIAAAARAYYDRFAPFQFLAYWYELWHRAAVDG